MKLDLQEYCMDFKGYSRFLTREVMVGDVSIGANNPI